VGQVSSDKALGGHAQGIEREEHGAAQGPGADGGEGYGSAHGSPGEHR
jgi:hypothetical protein